MPITLRPFTDQISFNVFQGLDPMDVLEAEIVRGGGVASGAALWADWRSIERGRVISHVVCDKDTDQPFAVVGLAHTGESRVAQAALLSKQHSKYRRQLLELAIVIRKMLPTVTEQLGIHRVECRCWADHPTAAGVLTLVGFHQEAVMQGFGAGGRTSFLQFAWTPNRKGETLCVT